MDHVAIQNKLYEYHDGALDEKSAEAVKVHLLECPDCRELYSQWKKTVLAFFPKSCSEPSEFFVSQVMERIEVFESTSKKPLMVGRAQWGWLVPAMGLAIVFMMLLQMPSNLYVSAESLIDNPGDLRQAVFSATPYTSAEVLDFVMGGYDETTV